MTKDEIIIALNLDQCTYLPGSFEKKFARDICGQAKGSPEKELTEAQRDWLYKQLKRYRRQIPATYQKYHPDNSNNLNL
jgi:hypothetical protein